MCQLIHINKNGVNLSLNISKFLVWLKKKKKLSHRSLSNRSQPPLFLLMLLLLLLPSQAPLQALPHHCQHHLARWRVPTPLLLSFHGMKVIHQPTTHWHELLFFLLHCSPTPLVRNWEEYERTPNVGMSLCLPHQE